MYFRVLTSASPGMVSSSEGWLPVPINEALVVAQTYRPDRALCYENNHQNNLVYFGFGGFGCCCELHGKVRQWRKLYYHSSLRHRHGRRGHLHGICRDVQRERDGQRGNCGQ